MIIGPQLERRLEELGVQTHEATEHSIRLSSVPLPPSFNSSVTDLLLVRRDGAAGPFVVLLVNEDLAYAGGDPAKAHQFKAAPLHRRWKALTLPVPQMLPEAALVEALRYLEVAVPLPPGVDADLPGSPATRFGTSLVSGLALPALGREQQLDRAMSCLLPRRPRLLLISGEEGCGKRSFLAALAERLSARGKRVRLVNLAVLFAGASTAATREGIFAQLLAEFAHQYGFVLALDRIEMLCDLPCARALLQLALDSFPVVGLSATPLLCMDGAGWNGESIELRSADPASSRDALDYHRPILESFHSVRIPPEVLTVTLQRSLSLPGPLPAKAVTLLDLASTRAALNGCASVEEIHVLLAASGMDFATRDQDTL